MGTISGMGESLRTMPPTCWPRLLGRVHQLGGQGQQVTPAGCLHLIPEGGQLQHLALQVTGVVGVELLGKHPQIFFGSPKALPRSWMIPFTE